MLVVTVHYGFRTCYCWEKLGKVHTEALSLIFSSRNCMCIYSFLGKSFSLKQRRREPETLLCKHRESETAPLFLIVIALLFGPELRKSCSSLNICRIK